jgi:hypothetical protein
MMLGLQSEALEELSEAMTNQDVINLKEEYGDIAWYAANLADIENVNLELQSPSNVHWTTCIGKLASEYKRHFIYGKELNKLMIDALIINLMYSLDSDYTTNIYMRLEEKEGYSFDDVLIANIEKLKVRYPEKYSDELASERLDKVDE